MSISNVYANTTFHEMFPSVPMSRCTRSVIILVPLTVFILIATQFFELSETISKISSQTFQPARLQRYHADKWRALRYLDIPRHPQIGKCTVATGENYNAALRTQLDHSDYHGYPTFTLDRKVLDGLWSKEAALLEMMLETLSKPAGERLKWIFWFDADTVIMNKLIPLEAFIPPDSRNDVNLLYTKDWNGLNNGVFMLKVSEWSVAFLASIVAYRTFKPEEHLVFTEQSAMERVLELEQYRDAAVQCPPQWFNAYPRDDDEEDGVHFEFAAGQLLVHFAGIGDKGRVIGEWVEKLESDRKAWEMPIEKTNYEMQIAEFWEGLEMERDEQGDSGEK